MDYVIRFVAGGAIVSIFALLGDVIRPKSVAGLLGAAPSVALATLTLAFFKATPDYIAIESRSMIVGALAFTAYCAVVCQLLMRAGTSALQATLGALAIWLIGALSLEMLLFG